MRLLGKVIPQADKLEGVVRVVEAVHEGARTDQEIGLYLKQDSDDPGRHGRYYRPAAESLGFIINEQNCANLTPQGKALVNSSGQSRKDMLLATVLSGQFFQRLILFLEQNPGGVTRQQLIDFIVSITTLSKTTADRRLSSILNWLKWLDAISQQGKKYKLSSTVAKRTGPLELVDAGDPALLKTSDLKKYRTVLERMSKAQKATHILRNEVAVERADNAHRRLVNLVADRISVTGSLPYYNKLMDLYTFIDGQEYIFEMKSITQANARSQIRSGISQLYEYRYLHALPEALLVLVIEKPLPAGSNWMQEYLEKDRQVRLVWDGNNDLYASSETQNELSYLWPK